MDDFTHLHNVIVFFFLTPPFPIYAAFINKPPSICYFLRCSSFVYWRHSPNQPANSTLCSVDLLSRTHGLFLDLKEMESALVAYKVHWSDDGLL